MFNIDNSNHDQNAAGFSLAGAYVLSNEEIDIIGGGNFSNIPHKIKIGDMPVPLCRPFYDSNLGLIMVC